MERTALITGASAGIGLELARLFARDRYNLVLVARNAVALEKLAAELASKFNIKALPVPADLANSNAPNHIFSTLEREGMSVDVLVNNAGFALNGPFVRLDTQGQLDEIQVNVVALTHLTRLFLPTMAARKFGAIVNIASTAAFVPGPMMAVYYATKAYVLSFSEAIANEVADDGVTVTCVCPGATLTEFQIRAGMQQTQLFKSSMAMDAGTVAQMAYHGFKSRQTVVITGAINSLAVFMSRLLPRSLSASITRKLQDTGGRTGLPARAQLKDTDQ